MKFEEAMKLLFEGKKVRRKSWRNKEFYLDKNDEYQLEDPCLSLNDLNATDWFALTSKNAIDEKGVEK